jgi:hypothetical protein
VPALICWISTSFVRQYSATRSTNATACHMGHVCCVIHHRPRCVFYAPAPVWRALPCIAPRARLHALHYVRAHPRRTWRRPAVRRPDRRAAGAGGQGCTCLRILAASAGPAGPALGEPRVIIWNSSETMRSRPGMALRGARQGHVARCIPRVRSMPQSRVRACSLRELQCGCVAFLERTHGRFGPPHRVQHLRRMIGDESVK